MSNRLKEAMEALELAASSLSRGNDSLSALAFRLELHDADKVEVATKPGITAAALKSWNEYLHSPNREPATRELKRLCWEPTVALEPRFVDLLKVHLGDRLSRRCQAGLVYSLAIRWDAAAENETLADPLCSFLFGNPSFKYAHQVRRYLNQKDGIACFVKEKTQAFPVIPDVLKETFGLVLEGTQYAAAVRAAIGRSYSDLLFSESVAARRWLYSEVLKPLEKHQVVSIIGRCVSNQVRVPSEPVLNDFRDFLLEYKDLGDPRAEGGSFKWKGVPDTARQKVSEWLSQEDIRVFFDTFFDEGNDRQGRKEFWMRYAHRVQRTRVVVGDDDLGKRGRLSKSLRSSSTVGTLRDGDGSAFVMDFGSVVVVEFSRANNACYFYAPDSKCAVITKFWSPSFRTSDLKNRDIGRYFAHHHQIWQRNLGRELSLLGVRPREG